MDKIIQADCLAQLRANNPGKCIALCHGVFDLFHYGHLLYLQSAKKKADILVVTVTADSFVNKGPNRPYNSEQKRAEMLANLAIVDYVAINPATTAEKVILNLKPDFYVKGPDYKKSNREDLGNIQVEKNAVKIIGSEIFFTEDEVDSSSKLLNKYFHQWDKEEEKAVEKIKQSFSIETILNVIDQLKNLKVVILGEPIIDTYIFCEEIGSSNKTPTIAVRDLWSEDYAGGALAVANHLASLGCCVTAIVPHGNESVYQKIIKYEVHPKIILKGFTTPSIPTPRKLRYITANHKQKMLEVVHIAEQYWITEDPKPFCEFISKQTEKADILLIADFGHGLFEKEVLTATDHLKPFKALNAQTNSSNIGFNLFSKHKNFNYLSINQKELKLAAHNKNLKIEELIAHCMGELIPCPTSITLGKQGSLYSDTKGKISLCPSFFKKVVDTTGSGDAYFAITSLLSYLGTDDLLITFLGNCFAGLQAQIIGNKKAVDKQDLIKVVKALLA